MGEIFSPSHDYLLVALFFLGIVAANIFGLSLYSKIARKSVHDAQDSRNTAFSDVVITSASTEAAAHFTEDDENIRGIRTDA